MNTILTSILQGSCAGLCGGIIDDISKFYFTKQFNWMNCKINKYCRTIISSFMGFLIGYYFFPGSILIFILCCEIKKSKKNLLFMKKKKLVKIFMNW